MSYIGKFVCYDQADGGACWGRIKDEAIVNTMKGEREVFILEHRYVRYWRTKNLKNFRRFYPGMDVGDVGMSMPGSLDKSEELFMETKKIKGDSTLRKEMIDLENDIVDLDDVLGAVDNDMLFKAVLNVKNNEVNGRSALEIGLQALLKDPSLSDEATRVLRKRLQ